MGAHTEVSAGDDAWCVGVCVSFCELGSGMRLAPCRATIVMGDSSIGSKKLLQTSRIIELPSDNSEANILPAAAWCTPCRNAGLPAAGAPRGLWHDAVDHPREGYDFADMVGAGNPLDGAFQS